MASITATLSSLVNRQAAASLQATSAQSATAANTQGGFGDATNLTLSPAAQAVVSGQGAQGTSTSGTGASGTGAAPATPPAGGGGAPVGVSSSTSTDTSLLEEEALQQVALKIGYTDAANVVDSKGDINYAQLNAILLQQQVAQAAKQSAAA